MPILGILGHVIVNWHSKKQRFFAWKFINSHITQKPIGLHNWNLYTFWVIINGLCKPTLGAPGHMTKMLQAKNGQKVDDFEPIYLGKYRFWWKTMCFLSTLSTAFLLVMFVYPNLNTFFFLLLLFFLFRLSTFKLVNALYSKFERLKISGRTSAVMKSGVPYRFFFLYWALQNPELLNR